MKNTEFLRGVGLGLAAGATIGFTVAPKKKGPSTKSTAGRAIRAVGDVVEQISDAMGK
ncbi:MAG: hypothetical protein PHT34_03405 [Oscillospiraceae bacterium]|nr:hypothetical protein [Oscillospiraceae bacterium]